MLVKFSGLNPKGPYLSLEKENFCTVLLTYSIKQVREIRKFPVAVVQQRLRNNIQKSKLFFANLNLLFSFAVRRRHCKNSPLL